MTLVRQWPTRLGQKLDSIRRPAVVLAFLLLISFIVASGWTWHAVIYDKPSRAWHDMLAQSLTTKTVTIKVVQTAQSITRQQVTSYETAPQLLAKATSSLTRAHDTATVDTVGTLDADYVRYTAGVGQAALNVWAEDPHKNQGASANRQLVPDAILRLEVGMGVPLSAPPAKDRPALLKQLNAAVQMNGPAKMQVVNGQSSFVYQATIKPQAYATYLKALAADLGLKQLTSDDPNNYKNMPAITAQLVVGRQYHQLTQLTYADVKNYTETYTAYNQPITITIPTKTIDLPSLQTKLTSK